MALTWPAAQTQAQWPMAGAGGCFVYSRTSILQSRAVLARTQIYPLQYMPTVAVSAIPSPPCRNSIAEGMATRLSWLRAAVTAPPALLRTHREPCGVSASEKLGRVCDFIFFSRILSFCVGPLTVFLGGVAAC